MAWIAGGASFAAPWGALALAPRPSVAAVAAQPPQVIIRRIIRHVYLQGPVQRTPRVRYVYVSGGSGGGAPPPARTGGSKP
jgi:hypothetical protein